LKGDQKEVHDPSLGQVQPVLHNDVERPAKKIINQEQLHQWGKMIKKKIFRSGAKHKDEMVSFH